MFNFWKENKGHILYSQLVHASKIYCLCTHSPRIRLRKSQRDIRNIVPYDTIQYRINFNLQWLLRSVQNYKRWDEMRGHKNVERFISSKPRSPSVSAWEFSTIQPAYQVTVARVWDNENIVKQWQGKSREAALMCTAAIFVTYRKVYKGKTTPLLILLYTQRLVSFFLLTVNYCVPSTGCPAGGEVHVE
jgi:hypothetical protein